MIEYRDSSVAATLHSSGGSLHLKMLLKALVAVVWTFPTVPKLMSFEVGFSLENKKKSHEAKTGLYSGWGSVVILF